MYCYSSFTGNTLRLSEINWLVQGHIPGLVPFGVHAKVFYFHILMMFFHSTVNSLMTIDMLEILGEKGV